MRREARPFEVAWAVGGTGAALKATYQADREPAIRKRHHALGLLGSG